MTEQFANNASSILNGSIDNVTTTINVQNGNPFSNSGTFRILIDSEIMIVTAHSGTTMTVIRGQEGTVATTHNSGATVTQIITSGSLAQFRADNVLVSSYASRGSAGLGGRVFYATDPSPVPFFDNGSSWQPIVNGILGTQPPAASNWSLFSGTSTLVDSLGTLLITPSTADELWRYTGTLNSSFTVITALSQTWKPGATDGPGLGVFVRNSSVTASNVGYVRSAIYATSSATSITVQVQNFTGSGTPGTPSTVNFTATAPSFNVGTYWIKTNWNNATSTLTFSFSNNGVDYYQAYSGTPFQASPTIQFGLLPMASASGENLCRLLSMSTS